MASSSAKNPAANLALFLLSFLFACLAGEIALRVLIPENRPPARPQGWAIIPESSWIEYHPQLGWFQQKNKTSELVKNGKTVQVQTNSMGLRGKREYPIQREPGSTRIYALGDSFTFGFGVEDAETFSAVLERRNPRFEVMNLGVPGYGVDQMRLLLDAFGFPYKPDMVLISVYPEDFWRATRAFNDAGFGKPYYTLLPGGKLKLHHVPVPRDKNFSTNQFPELQDWGALSFLSRSYLVRFVIKAVNSLKKKWKMEDPDTSLEWQLGRAILAETAASVKAAGATPVFIMVPPARWITGTVEPVRDSLMRFAEREKVLALDLTPYFQQAVREKNLDAFYIPDDLHWTAEGHELAAAAIRKLLKEKRLVS